jgi:pyruvate/2-oxoglutarate dehydrogenase complex dihydrolipoamide acyltransferase (E2) component
VTKYAWLRGQGNEHEHTWKFRNPSWSLSWPTGTTLRLVKGPEVGVTVSAPLRVATAPHGERSFTVRLRAPATSGQNTTMWRLYTPEGHPFGDVAWCTLHVLAPPPDAEPAAAAGAAAPAANARAAAPAANARAAAPAANARAANQAALNQLIEMGLLEGRTVENLQELLRDAGGDVNAVVNMLL